jgi:hypothetical protein
MCFFTTKSGLIGGNGMSEPSKLSEIRYRMNTHQAMLRPSWIRDDVFALLAELAAQAEEIRRLTEERKVALIAGVVLNEQHEADAAEIRRLREALEPFARIVPYLGVLPDRESISDLHDFTAGQCRRAAKAMEKG